MLKSCFTSDSANRNVLTGVHFYIVQQSEKLKHQRSAIIVLFFLLNNYFKFFTSFPSQGRCASPLMGGHYRHWKINLLYLYKNEFLLPQFLIVQD